jgi:uncharacterized lipoprotein YddW (UPF0748 family)
MFVLFSGCIYAQNPPPKENNVSLGVWVTVFSPEKPLYSTGNADKMLRACKVCGVTDIYLQVYRANKAYYDSDIMDRSAFDKILESAGTDTVKYILREASSLGIKVHAWVNMLSLAQNSEADILRKFGNAVLTRDQFGRDSMGKGGEGGPDKGFIKEDQLFLEAGDYRVRGYLTEMVGELLIKYPSFEGLHLDYIRYPSAVPFIPGSRFTSHGLSYGYNKMNIKSFETKTGLSPRKMPGTRKNYHTWDEWRRSRITTLMRYVSVEARQLNPKIHISCAVVPSLERSYLVTFQDWRDWIEKGYADHIVFMNYTEDTEYMSDLSASVMGLADRKNIRIGLGAYLLKDEPERIREQIDSCLSLDPGGIVLFSYAEAASLESLRSFLKDIWGTPENESIVDGDHTTVKRQKDPDPRLS